MSVGADIKGFVEGSRWATVMFEKFIERVEEKGFDVRRVGGDGCLLLLVKRGEKAVLVGVYKGEYRGLYAKISLLEHVPATYWSCDNLVYVPHGLYTFADDEVRLADQAVEKIAKLIRV